MSITSITYMVVIHILYFTRYTLHVWPNQHAHLSIVQYAIMCTCMREKYIYIACSTHISGVKLICFASHPLFISWMRGCRCNTIQKVARVDNNSTVTSLNTLLCSFRPKKPEIYETESPHLERMRNANYASLRHFAFPYEYEISSLLLRLSKKRR